jgi:uncharacterized protein
MHFAQEEIGSELIIRAYEQGAVTVGNTRYSRSLILTRTRLISDWPPQDPATLKAEDFAPVLAERPEIVLLGTGRAIHFPPREVTAGLLQAGIGVEVMDTAAACRTYNILLSEQRNLVAALLLG